MAASLREIAKLTHVSIGTVSKALNGRDDVSAEKRREIQEVARELRYRPNLLVRGIQTGRTGTIGVMVPVEGNDFYTNIVSGIHAEMNECGDVPLLLWSNKKLDGSWSGPTELEQIHKMIDRRVDGVIIRPVEDEASDDYLHEIRDHRLPLVAVDRMLPNSHLADFVGTDDRLGGRMAAEHLLALGHRRIAHLAGPSFTSTARDRRIGFEKALGAAAGVRYTVREERSYVRGEKLAAELLQPVDGERPTAIFAASDFLAAGIYTVARELGLVVGRDLSVIGFADLSFCQWLYPTLTTIRQDPLGIGREAVRLIHERITHADIDHQPVQRRLLPELILRNSTCPPDSI